MKKLNYCWSFVMILALLFTSCSKDEATDVMPDQDTFQLQFGTLLNDFAKQSKDHLSDDPVVCRDAAPSYVLVALTDSNNNWVAGKNPEAVGADENDFIKVNIKNNAGSWETDFSDELGLPAGNYQLQYFIVYSADNQVLWVAPREGGAYASSVGDPLPQEIVLAAGTKPYVEVDVLCFIPRVEEAFGYIFFDINLITVENNYCIFVNYCNEGDEGDDGREYPALFEVDVWSDGFGGDDVVIDGAMNSVSGEGNNFAATVLCFPLPPLEGDDTYFVRVTVLSAGNYTADASDFFEFEISQADIDAQLLETPRYEHIRINCGTPPDDCPITPEDSDGDCVPDNDDICPGFDDNIDTDGDGLPDGCDPCPTVHKDLDNDGDCVPDDDDICPGFDDNIDTDNDGIPDGCDTCPGFDDNVDTDGDGVPNGCDICPGGDDFIDTDGDTIPDFCDSEDPDLEGCETAFMVGNTTLISLDLGNKRWGWAEFFDDADGVYVYDVYAGAGQNDLSKGTQVGTVSLDVSGNTVSVTINLNSGVVANVTHMYFSDNTAPTTTAPGQYGNTNETDFTGSRTSNFNYSGDGDFWLIVHAEVCPNEG